MTDEIKIPSSKIKIFLLFLGAILFVIMGIWLLQDPEKFANSYYRARSPFFIQLVGIVGVLFFGICGIFIGLNLFSKGYGIVMNQTGVLINSGGPYKGFINWKDVTGLEIVKVHSQKFIMVIVSNPEFYIEKSNNKINELAMKANHKKYGSPISITANTLKINFKELKEVFEKQYAKHVID